MTVTRMTGDRKKPRPLSFLLAGFLYLPLLVITNRELDNQAKMCLYRLLGPASGTLV
jgi:hypothetical protein